MTVNTRKHPPDREIGQRMKVIDHGLVLNADGRSGGASFVSLCRLNSGTLVCGFQLSREEQHAQSTLQLCRPVDDDGNRDKLPARFDTHWHGTRGSLATWETAEPTAAVRNTVRSQ